jgi:hypothetical protein
LIDITVGFDWVWQVALSVLDQVLSAYSGKQGEYVLLRDFHHAVRSWHSGCVTRLRRGKPYGITGDRSTTGTTLPLNHSLGITRWCGDLSVRVQKLSGTQDGRRLTSPQR